MQFRQRKMFEQNSHQSVRVMSQARDVGIATISGKLENTVKEENLYKWLPHELNENKNGLTFRNVLDALSEKIQRSFSWQYSKEK